MKTSDLEGQFKAGVFMGRAYAMSPFTLAGMWWGLWLGSFEKMNGVYPWRQ